MIELTKNIHFNGFSCTDKRARRLSNGCAVLCVRCDCVYVRAPLKHFAIVSGWITDLANTIHSRHDLRRRLNRKSHWVLLHNKVHSFRKYCLLAATCYMLLLYNVSASSCVCCISFGPVCGLRSDWLSQFGQFANTQERALEKFQSQQWLRSPCN